MREEYKIKLKIQGIKNLKNSQTSSIIYIESERDVTPTSK
jgi:hypothetical protein